MKVWVDADACPVSIREILFRAATRTQIKTILVANQFIRTPSSPYISMLQVGAGFDVADDEIVQRLEAGDLVITSDIPLAAEVIDKDALALSPRGQLFTIDNVKQRLNMRDFMDTMRSSGVHTGGPEPLTAADKQKFANELDKWLARQKKKIT